MTECTIVRKNAGGEYYSCYECDNCYAEELDNGALECWLGNRFYNNIWNDEFDTEGEPIYKICEDFVSSDPEFPM